MQHTLNQPITLTGHSLHKNEPVSVTIRPAPANTGIVFVRSDLVNTSQTYDVKQVGIKARYDLVQQMPLCTTIVQNGMSVSTIEHLMAAFVGCGVDNAVVEVHGPEMPILDGSALPYAQKIVNVGLKRQESPREVFEVLRKVEVRDGDKFAILEPGGNNMRFLFSIDFDAPAIGAQDCDYTHHSMHEFLADIAPARSFAEKQDVVAAQAKGMALGATMESGILVDGAMIVNSGGLRFEDEFVRHKVLDAMGDLSLAGGSVLGTFISHKGGHSLTNQLLVALFSDARNYRMAYDYIGLHERAGIPVVSGRVSVAQLSSMHA